MDRISGSRTDYILWKKRKFFLIHLLSQKKIEITIGMFLKLSRILFQYYYQLSIVFIIIIKTMISVTNNILVVTFYMINCTELYFTFQFYSVSIMELNLIFYFRITMVEFFSLHYLPVQTRREKHSMYHFKIRLQCFSITIVRNE